jgi:hypothetical protein
MTNELIDQFSLWLDQLLGLAPGQVSKPLDNPEAQTIAQAAIALHEMDFGAEAAPRAGLRSDWDRHFQMAALDQRSTRSRFRFTRQMAWIIALILALALLVAFRQPVMAAVGRLFGYIYVQDAGFLPADSTLVLQQPVMQVHNGTSLTVTRGVSRPEGTTLYIEYSDTAAPADGAFLETLPGSQLALSNWEYFPNTPGSHGVKLTFLALPEGITQTSLVLPAGWHLPLTWIPAALSGLPDVRAVPYVDATLQPTPAADLCVEKHGLRLCLQAATGGAESTSVLLEAQPINPALIPSSDMGLVMQSDTEPVTLQDEQGIIYRNNLRPAFGGTLTFPPLTGIHTLTLTVPAVFARVDIPDQMIPVDVGANPQPDTVIPLDANIQVLGATVHFSKATFVGDGVGSLRLTLNADDPIQSADGITPYELELGRPDRVDDLYGWGDLDGSQDIHVELMHGGKKITGVINLPIVMATVIVQGPFEFTFKLSDIPSTTPTARVANPNAFAPAPSPTPMSLDNYVYSGQTLQSGDLLYAAWNGSQSDVYRYNPASGTAPALFMTLPGQVFSIHLHADRAGMDYLTGTFNPDMVVESTALYTLRFSDPRPRLLHTSSEGIITYPVWSFDGRLMAFAFQLPDPGELWPRVGWIDMNCRSSGECPVQVLDAPAEYRLAASAFSPQGYWLAMDGVDTTYAAGEIYLLQFDNNAQPGQVQNITNTGGVFDGGPQWIAGNKLAWDCTISDANDPNKDIPNICLQDVLSGSASPQKIFTNNDLEFVFGLSSQGNYFWQNVFVRIDPGSYQMWLHDRNGGSRLLTASPWFDQDYGKPAFSMDERYLAYFSESYYDKSVPETLHIADTATGKELATFENINPVGWMGWVP